MSDCPTCDAQNARSIDCDNCTHPFDPIRYRWRCPDCGARASCCEGEPQ